MSITKTEKGWLVDIQPGGRGGKRYRKTFKAKADALQWERQLRAKVDENPRYDLPRKDTRRLSELVKLWFDLHGVNLKSSGDTYRRLQALASAMGDPLASGVTAQVFVDYRARRMAEGVAAATLNREHATLRAVFSELSRMELWQGPNPVAKLRRIRVDERELSFLSLDQIRRLFEALQASKNPYVYQVARVCLATGCRWSEAQGLVSGAVSLENSSITFQGTKSGRVRVIPVELGFADELLRDKTPGPLFGSCYSAFREAVDRAELMLPDGQLAHVLRHTFASHFMMGGGNILALQRILGHANLTMTMRYAHLAPEHLEEVKRLNPLARLTLG